MMKDLVEHIRTVHFALLLASIVLIAAGLSNPGRSLAQASRDALAINRLNSLQADLRKAVEDRAYREFGEETKFKQ